MEMYQETQQTALNLKSLKDEKPEAFYFIKGYIQRAVEESKIEHKKHKEVS